MNFLLTVCLICAYYYQVQHCDALEFDLDAFMKNFEKSQSELKWIRDESHKNEGESREWTDLEESNFDEDDESSVDHWYNKYRASECSLNQAKGVFNGYCGVHDENRNEYHGGNDNLEETDFLKSLPVSDFKEKPKYDHPEIDPLPDKFDNFEQGIDKEPFDVDSDSKLNLDLEEYNEQMIPNPNFYKINNESPARNEQISKDHDTLRDELGFSPILSKYPSSDVQSHFENDYGNENQNNIQPLDIKQKRNALDVGTINHMPHSRLNDQADTSKNDLSHEADYKLSKNEQDPKNKQEPKKKQDPQLDHEYHEENPGNEFGDVNPQNLAAKNLKNVDAGESVPQYNSFQEKKFNNPTIDLNGNSIASNQFFQKKQPHVSKPQKHLLKHDKKSALANEINLKISNRMMSKGLGPSLPSQAVKYYQTYRHSMDFDVENQQWKNSQNERNHDSTDFVGLQRRLLQFDYDESRNDYSIHNTNISPNDKSSKVDIIKSLDKDETSGSKTSKRSLTINNESKNPKQSETIPHNSTKLPKMEHISQAKTTNSGSNHTSQVHVDLAKIQLNVSDSFKKESSLANERRNDNRGNNHGKVVKRSATYNKAFGSQETKIQNISKNSSIVDLVSGKLPNQLIQIVFQLVKENSRLNDLLGSKLDMKIIDNLELNSINLFKSKQKAEKMVKSLMSSITDLIEDQITHQTCISLPADLQSFYDKVIHVRSINSRVNGMRKQMKTNADGNKNSTKRFARSTVPESDLHQKYKTVGKLLKQFEHLKLRDRMKIFDIKQYLQNHLNLLDDLKSFNSEYVRKSRSVGNKNKDSTSQEVKASGSEKGNSHISRQYANLLKTTKLIKTTSLTDMDTSDVSSTY